MFSSTLENLSKVTIDYSIDFCDSQDTSFPASNIKVKEIYLPWKSEKETNRAGNNQNNF